MSNISNRFYIELFDRKSVQIDPQLYKELYYSIWPCEEHFISFLQETDPNLRLDAAKKIYSSVEFVDDVFLPTQLMKNVIKSQYTKWSKNIEGYVSQDHVIHSVNLYILGIYIFFNHSALHRGLIQHSLRSDSYYSATKSFIKKWRLFALYHDLGYFLEDRGFSNTLPINDVDIELYKNLSPYLAVQYASKSVSRFIITANQAVNEFKNIIFNVNDYSMLSSHRWNDISRQEILFSDLQKRLAKFNSAKCVAYDCTISNLNNFAPLLENSFFLIVIYDYSGICVGFAEFENNELSNLYYIKDSCIDKPGEVVSKEFVLRLLSTCTSFLYVSEVEGKVKSIVPVPYKTLYPLFYNNLPDTQKNDFAFASNDRDFELAVEGVANKITKLMRKRGEQPDKKWFISAEHSISNYYVTALKNEIINTLDQQASKKEIDSSNIAKILNDWSRSLRRKDIREKIINDTQNEVARHFRDQDGAYTDILNFTERCYLEIVEILKDELLKSKIYNVLQLNEKQEIAFSPFVYWNPNTSSNDSIQKLFRQITLHANSLNTSVEKLCCYHTDFSDMDHGVTSASLLFHAVAVNLLLLSHRDQLGPAIFSWIGFENQTNRKERIINECAEVIFAVLIHNIYVKSKVSYGIDYKHNFRKEPFAYFSTLCDTLQKWERTKRINPGYVEQPKYHYLENNFDLACDEQGIKLFCMEKYTQNLKDWIYDAESFLPGISKIVVIQRIADI